MRSRLVAVADIGTNTIKYSVADVTADGRFRDIDAYAETVRLGAGIGETGRIDPERAGRAVQSLRRYQLRATAHGATAFVGVATSALRRASNGQALLDDIASQTAWDIRVISGSLEADLTWAGLQHLLPPRGDFLLADIGGGSTELIAIRDGVVLASESRDIGSGVLADESFTCTPPRDEVEQALTSATRSLAPSAVIPMVALPTVVLSGGNGEFLSQLAQWPAVGVPFTPETMSRLMRRIAEMEPAITAGYLGIAVERAQLLPAGAAIACAIVQTSHGQRMAAVPSGIRSGIVREWAAGTW